MPTSIAVVPQSYPELRQAVKVTMVEGQQAVEQAKVRTYHETAEGRAAKRFVETLIARATAVTICTTKPDKYDRYLADVFLTLDDGSTVFLNNALLENGHAVRKEDYDVADWGL